MAENEKYSTEFSKVDRKPMSRVPFYLREDILKLSVQERKEKIFAYHIEMHKIISEARRKSIDFVPWSKPILLTAKNEKWNDSLLKQKDEDVAEELYMEEQKEEDKVYILQTKRTHHNQDTLMSPVSSKKPKLQNKNKLRNAMTTVEKSMNGSSRFGYKDKPKTYTDKIFDKLAFENKKRQQEEDEMYRFQQTLATVDDEEELDDFNDEKYSSAEEYPSHSQRKRRKIVPSDQMKKKLFTIKRIKDKIQAREVQQKKRSNSQTPRVDLNANVDKCHTTQELLRNDTSKNKVHAATCGKTGDDEPSLLSDVKSQRTITCSLCDKAFMVGDEFHEHMNQCLG